MDKPRRLTGDNCPSEKAATGTSEDRILLMFREILQQPDLNADDDFFRSGGDSLTAMSLVKQVRMELGREVKLATFLENTTARQFAAAIDATDDQLDVTDELDQWINDSN